MSNMHAKQMLFHALYAMKLKHRVEYKWISYLSNKLSGLCLFFCFALHEPQIAILCCMLFHDPLNVFRR